MSSISAIENASRYGEARKLAETDPLTGLYNQRFFHETLRREVTRAHRYQRKLTLIVFDLDDFKSINDRSATWREIASSPRRGPPPRGGSIHRRGVRIGGDEFAVLIPESSAEDGEGSFGGSRVDARHGLGPTRSGSGSRGHRRAGARRHAGEPLRARRRGLYRAKELGKDRAEIARASEVRMDH